MTLKEVLDNVSERLRSQYTNEALRRLYTLYLRLEEFFKFGVDSGVMPAIASVNTLKWSERFYKSPRKSPKNPKRLF